MNTFLTEVRQTLVPLLSRQSSHRITYLSVPFVAYRYSLYILLSIL